MINLFSSGPYSDVQLHSQGQDKGESVIKSLAGRENFFLLNIAHETATTKKGFSSYEKTKAIGGSRTICNPPRVQ